MNRTPGGLSGLNWKLISGAVAAVVAAALIAPWAYLLKQPPIPEMIAAGAIGYGARLRILDAALLVGALLLAQFNSEPVAAPQVLCFLILGVLGISGRPRFALFVGAALFAMLLFCIELKLRFAGSILTVQDVYYFLLQFRDNVGVLASQPTLLIYLSAAVLVFGAVAIWLWKQEAPVVAAPGQRSRVWPYAVNGIALLVALWCASELNDASRIKGAGSLWMIGQSTRPVSAFLSTMHLEAKPEYRKVDTKKFAADVQTLRSTITTPGDLPDIVVFLQESQFNLQAIAGCPPAICNLDIFAAQATTTDNGEFRVHVFGGGTWLSEFSLQTGLPHTIFGHAGEFASFNVAPRVERSFVRSLRAAGYYTVAVYPVGGGMMNAREAYRAYGFDEFLDAKDLGLSGAFDTPDSLLYEAAVRTLRSAQRHGKPVFLMAVTIFNHAEHGIRMDRVPDATRRAADQVFNQRIEADNLGDFIWRTQEFGIAYKKAREAILGSNRRSLLAWFGDHQPPFGTAPRMRGSIRSLSYQSRAPDRFLTWYNVETNFRLLEIGARSQQLDIVFLPGLLAQRSGVPLDEWLAANIVARTNCAGLLIECPDASWRDAYYTYLLDDLRLVR